MHINLPLWKQKLNEGKLHHFKITARTVKIHQLYWVTHLQSKEKGILHECSSSIFTTSSDHHLASQSLQKTLSGDCHLCPIPYTFSQ
jgi:hypothetical protein